MQKIIPYKTFIVGVLVLMSLISKLASAAISTDYRYLSDNLTESENYEIKKIINGRLDLVLSNSNSKIIVVKADGYLWKINDRGMVIDTLYKTDDLYESGVIFTENSSGETRTVTFVDWVYTGNKSEQSVTNFIDAKYMSTADLKAILDKADIVEFFKGDTEEDKKYGMCVARIDNRWIAIDISDRYDAIDSNVNYRYPDKPTETSLDGYEKNKNNIFYNISENDDYLKNLEYIKFDREFYHFSLGFGEWLMEATLGNLLAIVLGRSVGLRDSYWYGDQYLQLNHKSEKLEFKVFSSKLNGNIKTGMRMFDFPASIKDEIKFIHMDFVDGDYIDGRSINSMSIFERKKFHEHDVGLYVLRKKQNRTLAAIEAAPKSNVTSGQPLTYSTRNPWSPVFTGQFIPESRHVKSAWGDIHFYNRSEEPRHYLSNVAAVPINFHSIPRTLTFHWDWEVLYKADWEWDWSDKNTTRAFKLYLGEKKIAWLNLYDGIDDLFFELELDEAEIVSSFQKLDGEGSPLQMDIHLKSIDKYSANLTVSLRNKNNSVELKQAAFRHVLPDSNNNDQLLLFELSKLKYEYEKVLKDKLYLQDFMDVTQNFVERNSYEKVYASHVTNYSADLLLKFNVSSDFKISEALFFHYVNKLLPYTKHETNTEDTVYNTSVIASQGLIVSIVTHNDAIGSVVLDKLMAPGFDIATQKNVTFIFNLACYYAVHKEKELLLKSIKQAMKLGMSADKFKTDSDFKDYWGDAGFISALEL